MSEKRMFARVLILHGGPVLLRWSLHGAVFLPKSLHGGAVLLCKLLLLQPQQHHSSCAIYCWSQTSI